MAKKISRRGFLKMGCLTAAAAGTAVCGVGAVWPASREPVTELPSYSYGGDEMETRILVAYASRAGSTAGVADAIGHALAEKGVRVDVRPMREITDVKPYAAVIAGSAIQGGWLPEAIEFVRVHREDLASKPFAAFLVCITLAMRGGESYRGGLGKHMEPVRALVQPVGEGFFAGRLDLGRLPAPDRLKMSIPVALGIFPQGDHRDWQKIQTWAEEMRPQLVA
ncbi:MAG: flavodoxin domain-containing protein [Anaerolineales bacterium]